MSEFKFACPVCGQHITADSKDTGSQISCPTCFRKIVIPQAPSTTDPKFVLSASEANKPRPIVTAPPLESAPPPQKGPAISIALIILLVLACAAGATLFLLRGKLFTHKQPDAPQQSVEKSNAPPAQPAQEEIIETNSLWTLDLTNAIPDTAAAGTIHHRAFTCDRAVLQGGRLTLRAGRSGPTELAADVYFFTKEPEDLIGRSAEIKPSDPKAPRILLRWKEGDKVQSESFKNGGYAMKVEFGTPSGGRLPGKIFLAVPNESKSWLAGTFTAEMKKAAPPKPKPPTQ